MSKAAVLTSNVHEGLFLENSDNVHLVSGDYEYYHYMCDGVDDRGWGCGYRTLQTICSWMTHNFDEVPAVPTIREIQEIMIDLEDRCVSFLGSKEWIGSFEVCIVIDSLYLKPCKIIHVKKDEGLLSIIDRLVQHFDKFGSPVMMGGDVDCSSKGIMGVDVGGSEPSLLIVDPHYVGKEETKEFLQNKGWVKWQPVSEFITSSFYNLCLPQVKHKNKQ